MVMVPPAVAVQCAETPVGKLFPPDTPSLLIPVARVVVWVMAVKTVLIHNVGDDDAALAVMLGVTMIVPVALTVPQPPVSGMM